MKFMIEKSQKRDKAENGTACNTLKRQPDNQTLNYNIDHPASRVQCDVCKRNISKGVKILLLTEVSPNQDLCMSCFANVDEFSQEYYLTNKLNFPLLDPTWSGLEELLLFEGLQIHGFGNWTDIAEIIGTGKNRDQVQQHYIKTYINQPDFMPPNNILTQRSEDGTLLFNETQSESNPSGKAQNKSTAANTNVRASTTAGQPNKQSSNPAEVVGFMPRRGDFEVQYDNDAELLLAEMEFNDDDSEQEKAMKFRLIDIYNHKLDERIMRKEFIISRKLLDIKEQMRLDKARTKEEKEIHNLMKVLARFNTPEDHEKLVQDIIKEKQLRQRIAELRELQARGVKTWGEVEEEFDGKKKKDDKNKKKEENVSVDKSKTRRIARKDINAERMEKRVLFVSKQEQGLCRRLNMTFRQYMGIKEKILKEAVRMGLASRSEITQGIQMNKRAVEAVFDFLVEQQEYKLTRREPEQAES